MNLKKKIEDSKKDTIWHIGNQTLYDLCIKYPSHNKEKEITAKIWLIGRAYAASIERRQEKKDINDDFYGKKVVPKIQNSNIDELISTLKSEDLKSILELHNRLTGLFYKITGEGKRSLASKYLHFHLPNIYYIYDSRVAKSLGNLSNEMNMEKLEYPEYLDDYDKVYSNFFYKCKAVADKILIDYKINLTPRQFDNLLISIANENLRSK